VPANFPSLSWVAGYTKSRRVCASRAACRLASRPCASSVRMFALRTASLGVPALNGGAGRTQTEAAVAPRSGRRVREAIAKPKSVPNVTSAPVIRSRFVNSGP
jgi:hypothetical protein